jgi:hypothetical protein
MSSGQSSKIQIPIILKTVAPKPFKTPVLKSNPKKKGYNPYIVFSTEIRNALKNDNVLSLKNLAREANLDQMTLISNYWKSLLQNDREIWLEMMNSSNFDQYIQSQQELKNEFIAFAKSVHLKEPQLSAEEQVREKLGKMACQLDRYCSRKEIYYKCACWQHGKTNYQSILGETWGGCLSCAPERSKKTFILKYGCEHPMQLQSFKDKQVQTTIERFGVTHAMKNDIVKVKHMQTLFDNHGVKHPAQSPDILSKICATNISRYGSKYALQNPDVIAKVIATNMRNRGVPYPGQDQHTIDKMEQTNMSRYGFKCSLQNQDVKNKSLQTSISRYGTSHPMQNPVFALKHFKSATTLKSYTFPSGKIVKVQGYEPFALNHLVTIYGEDNIMVNLHDEVPVIPYLCPLDNIWRQYFPDIFIPSENLIIEVKSTYTFDIQIEKNLAKFKAVIDAGYLMKIMIMKKSGDIYRTIESVEDCLATTVELDPISEYDEDQLGVDENECPFDGNIEHLFDFSNDKENNSYINGDDTLPGNHELYGKYQSNDEEIDLTKLNLDV